MTTIAESVLIVLKENGRSMIPKEIYEEIKTKSLYDFKAKDPVAVITSTIRKNSDARSGNLSPLFHRHEDGSYSIK